MSWGSKITILYLGFVTLIITLVVICFGHKTELEFKDYYARETRFQEQINARDNANMLTVPITHELNENGIVIFIPVELDAGDINGTIHFLRPSDSSKDRNIVLKPGADGKQFIERSNFDKGVYKMRISFRCGKKEYYKEEVINFK